MSDDEDIEQSHTQARHLHAFLKAGILWGSLAAGTVITAAALVRRHKVSSKAASDALISLEDEGLVGRGDSEESAVVTETGKFSSDR